MKMDEELEKLYIRNIEEYIFDEDKIVTYKWLSKAFDIHVNTAKQLLYTFTTEVDLNRKTELQLTYLVGGVLHGGKGCRFQIVREDDLPKVKSQFKLITSEHIYSVHKSRRLPDLSILYGIDCIKETEDGTRMQGTIQCSKSVRRLEEQLAELRLQSRAASLCGNGKLLPQVTKNGALKQKPKPEVVPKTEDKPSLFTTVSSKPSKPEKDVDNKNSEQVEAASTGKKAKASGNIASMFSAQSNKAKKPEGPEKKSSAPEETSRKSAGSIASMFANQTSKSKSKPESKPPDIKETVQQAPSVASSETKPEVSVKTKTDDEKIVTEKSDSKRKHQTNEKAKVASKGKAKKQKKSSGNSEPAKKRRRIVVASDSDNSDDDIFGKADEDDDSQDVVLEVQPQENNVEDFIPNTPQLEVNKGRKRKRKLVDRTFQDSEGYIVTEKQVVYASCSGSEGEEEEEKENDKNSSDKTDSVKPGTNSKMAKAAPSKKNTSPKKKPSPPQKGKQMTLTSFFKKN